MADDTNEPAETGAEPDKPPAHIRQAYAELDNALALGADDSVVAACKRLEAAGVDAGQAVKEARRRRAAAERQAAAGDDPEARTTPPKGRTATGKDAAKT